MVEFLLCVMILIITMFAAVQLMVMMYAYAVMAEGAKVGVRYAVVHGSRSGIGSGPGNVTAVQTEVLKYATFLSASNITVTYPDGNAAAPSRVRVELSYPFTFLNLWGLPTIRAAAQGRIMF